MIFVVGCHDHDSFTRTYFVASCQLSIASELARQNMAYCGYEYINGRRRRTREQSRKKAPDTKPNQRRTQNQPTRYYDQADASCELGPRGQLGWGSGLALVIWVGLGRVGQEVKKKQYKK